MLHDTCLLATLCCMMSKIYTAVNQVIPNNTVPSAENMHPPPPSSLPPSIRSGLNLDSLDGELPSP